MIGLHRQVIGALLAACFAAAGVSANTDIAGDITANAHWTADGSPYIVHGVVSVRNGAYLRIDPGVLVYMGPAAGVTIQAGSLQAVGTAERPIQVLSDKARNGQAAIGDWAHWRFEPGCVDTRLDHVQFRHGSGLVVAGSSPSFNHLDIEQQKGPAIQVDLAASPTGVGNHAAANEVNGIVVPAGEILGQVRWGVRGIPYVVGTGTVSVGKAPVINGLSVSEVQQGLSIDAVISGSRLSGADRLAFDAAGMSGRINGVPTDSSVNVTVSAAAAQTLGPVHFRLLTAAGWVAYPGAVTVVPRKPSVEVSGVVPAGLRRGSTVGFRLSGSSLAGATVSAPVGSGLTISNLSTAATEARFDLIARADAKLGAQLLSVSNPPVANGVANVSVTVNDALPQIDLGTIPTIVRPDGVEHVFQLSLTHADIEPHSFTLRTGDPSVVSVAPAELTIPVGERSVPIRLTGFKLGQTTFRIDSATIKAAAKNIFASNLAAGATVGPVTSSPVGVDVPFDANGSLPTGSTVPLISAPVGVDVPFRANTTLPAGFVHSVVSLPVAVELPFRLPNLPVGSRIEPILSAPVGVDVPFRANTTLPVGTQQSIVSLPTAVSVPYTLPNLPAGSAIGPLFSAPVGVTVR